MFDFCAVRAMLLGRLTKASRRWRVVWWEILLMMLSMFKAQLVMDWSQTTTWRTTHCMRWGWSQMRDTHTRQKQQLVLMCMRMSWHCEEEGNTLNVYSLFSPIVHTYVNRYLTCIIMCIILPFMAYSFLNCSGGFRGGGGAVAPPFGRWSALFSRAAGWTILTVTGLHATLSPGL